VKTLKSRWLQPQPSSAVKYKPRELAEIAVKINSIHLSNCTYHSNAHTSKQHMQISWPQTYGKMMAIDSGSTSAGCNRYCRSIKLTLKQSWSSDRGYQRRRYEVWWVEVVAASNQNRHNTPRRSEPPLKWPHPMVVNLSRRMASQIYHGVYVWTDWFECCWPSKHTKFCLFNESHMRTSRSCNNAAWWAPISSEWLKKAHNILDKTVRFYG